jgi:carbamoyl-phosphate synthase small subunit
LSYRALLALEDGSLFWGESIGYTGETVGEVVFNTSMTGYQEIMTDPSYAKQIVTLTYPHIGNVGINDEDGESAKPYAAGLIIKDLSVVVSNFRSSQTLSDWMQANKIVGIADIDTRRLTRILREKGAQNGCIMTGEHLDAQSALAKARGFAGLNGMDLAKEVTTQKAYEWTEGEWKLGVGFEEPAARPHHVVAFDYGIKRNIMRMLTERGCKLTVVPAKTPASEVIAMNPDGVFLSNGPGDPAPCDYAISAIQTILKETAIPVYGICLGHQLLGLAVGAKTKKMKFGHHGGNHPVQDVKTGQVMITAQNHGFAVDEASLPANVEVTHRSLFDGTNQGIALKDRAAFSFQGHPEASPGPHDVAGLFDQFIGMIQDYKKSKG